MWCRREETEPVEYEKTISHLQTGSIKCNRIKNIYNHKKFVSGWNEISSLGNYYDKNSIWPIPVAARSKAWVCGRSLSGLRFRIPPGSWMSVYCDCCA